MIVILLASGCRTAQSDNPTPGPDMHQVRKGLFAKTGFYCPQTEFPRQILLDAFPRTRFYEAECQSEHGDSTSAVVAIDSQGTLNLLDSGASFNMLLGVDTPPASARERLMEYAHLAVRLSGKAEWHSRLAFERSDIPAESRREARDTSANGALSWVDSKVPPLVHITLTTSSSVDAFDVAIGSDGQVIITGDRQIWPRPY